MVDLNFKGGSSLVLFGLKFMYFVSFKNSGSQEKRKTGADLNFLEILEI